MSMTSTPATKASRERLWKQWTVVVDLFVRKELSRRHIRPEDYRALHQRLLDACDSESADEQTEKLARQAADVARPWQSVESLNDAPANILKDLWRSCQTVNQKLHGSHSTTANMKWFSAALFVAVVVVAFFGTLISIGPGRDAGGTRIVQGRWSDVQHTVKSFMAANEGRVHLWTMGAIGGTAATIMAYVVFRSPRQT